MALGKLQAQFNNILSLALTGLDTSTSAIISAADTVIGAFGKLQAQLNTLSATASSKLTKNATDSITGTITVSGAGDIIVPSTPAGVTSAVNKAYVDNTINTGTKAWFTINSNTTVVAYDRVFVDTSAGAVTLTLPAAPNVGETVEILDVSGSFDVNNLTIARNTKKIMSLTEDMTVSSKNISFTLIYSGATYGWRIK